MSLTPEQEAARQVFLTDGPFYAERCVKIVRDDGEEVPLTPRAGQLRLEVALEQQRQEERPMRVIVLKARKLGFSTWVQMKLIQRATLKANHRALVVAHEHKTAGELFDIGDFMYMSLPNDPALPFLKPPLASRTRSQGLKMLMWGTNAREQMLLGDRGLNSRLTVDTAKNVQGGRGFTFHSVHCSEVAFPPWTEEKLTSVLNAVPKRPDTLIVIESTANGSNHFKARWERSVAGESAYLPVFAPWHEEPTYRWEFRTVEEREEFIDGIGKGEYGEDEPRLMEEFGCTPEQLRWRRFAIVDDCEGKVEKFKQEYPASPEEAFLMSGKHVFSLAFISQVIDDTRHSDTTLAAKRFPGRSVEGATGDPEHGMLIPSRVETKVGRRGALEVPAGALWVPAAATGHRIDSEAFWRVWEPPVTLGTELEKPADERRDAKLYVIGVDVAGGEENTKGDTAYHAINVIDHRTGRDVAEYRSRIDPDLLAEQVLLAALWYGQGMPMFGLPLVAVEVTGSWGLPTARTMELDYGYPRMYRRREVKTAKEAEQTLLGWDTNPATKRVLEDHMRRLLRAKAHGIRSAQAAHELTTYVRDSRGHTGPEDGSFSDVLMASMIARLVAHLETVPVLSLSGNVSAWTRPVRDRRTGY